MTKITLIFSLALLLGACDAPNNASSRSLGKTPEIIFKTVDVQTFKDWIDKEGTVLIDVNTPREFEAGHIKGAKNMDSFDPSLEDQIAAFDKSKIYLIYGRREHRSSNVMDKFRTESIFKLMNLEGGLVAWEEANMPLEK